MRPSAWPGRTATDPSTLPGDGDGDGDGAGDVGCGRRRPPVGTGRYPGGMTDPLRLDDDETHAPLWVWLVIGALVLIGAVTVLRWVLGAIAGLIGLAVLVLVVLVAVSIIRGAWRSRR